MYVDIFGLVFFSSVLILFDDIKKNFLGGLFLFLYTNKQFYSDIDEILYSWPSSKTPDHAGNFS